MPTVDLGRLKSHVQDLLEAAGTDPDVAGVVADSLVQSDMRGHSSHGVRMLPKYLDRIDASDEDPPANRIDPDALPVIERRDGPRVLIDGQDAFGRVVGRDAAELGIELADEHGVGVVGIRDGNHLGRMGEWAELAADSGFLFLAFVKGEAELVAPANSSDRRYSTNPVVAGIPTFDALEFPIVLDMATSAAAGGKVWEEATAGNELPIDWAVDEDGRSQSDPDAFLSGEGALLPLGGRVAGHKGYALGVVSELVGAILGNGVVAGERSPVHFNNMAAYFLVDPTWFTAEDEISRRVAALADFLRTADPALHLDAGAAAANGINLPGEPEHHAEQRHRESGLNLSAVTVDSLDECAQALGCDSL